MPLLGPVQWPMAQLNASVEKEEGGKGEGTSTELYFGENCTIIVLFYNLKKFTVV